MNTIIKSRKFMWLVGAVLVGLYFSPSLFHVALEVTSRRPVASAAPAAQPARTAAAAITAPVPVPAATSPIAASPSAPADPFPKLLGSWGGTVLLRVQGLCFFNFELRQDQNNQGQYLGNSTMRCTSFALPSARKVNPMIGLLNGSPVSTILTGSVVAGSLHFHVNKTIGEHCAPTEFILTPFGSSQLAMEWKDPSCGDGEGMLLRSK
jgi:hypothetical protein